MSLHGLLQLQEDVVVGIEREQQLVGEVAHMQLLALGEGVARVHHADRLAAVQHAGAEVGCVDRHGADHEIEPAQLQAFAQMRGAQRLQADRRARVLLHERMHHGRQHRQSQRRRAAYAQRARTRQPQALQIALYALQPDEMLLHGGIQLQRFGRGPQPALVHVEQLEACAGLHLREQAADRRLGGVQQLRGGGGRAGLHHGTEGFDFAKTQRAGHGVRVYQSCIGDAEKCILWRGLCCLHWIHTGRFPLRQHFPRGIET
ncbi:hypothetical protein D3C78_1045030 [compost metagenome]